MARNTALPILYSMLMARIGANENTIATQARYYQLLSDKQKWLANEYDFPFLEDRFDIPVVAGDRFLSFPTTDNVGTTIGMNLERPFIVEGYWSVYWRTLEYGIGSQEYNYLNSDRPGIRMDPVQRWKWATGTDTTKIEIWPIPNTAQTVRFTGQRALKPLVAAGDVCDLDDMVIVLFTAADILIRSKQADGQLVLASAQERLARQRGAYPGRPKGLVFGGGEGYDGTGQNPNARLMPIVIAG